MNQPIPTAVGEPPTESRFVRPSAAECEILDTHAEMRIPKPFPRALASSFWEFARPLSKAFFAWLQSDGTSEKGGTGVPPVNRAMFGDINALNHRQDADATSEILFFASPSNPEGLAI